MGLFPTPELLWNALPWTWLIDWFVNVDDIVRLVGYTPAENLYTDYAFVMERVMYTDERKAIGEHAARTTGSLRWGANRFSIGTTVSVETKARAGGSFLFGLGVTGGVSTTRQLGILAALGLSRSRL